MAYNGIAYFFSLSEAKITPSQLSHKPKMISKADYSSAELYLFAWYTHTHKANI